jgi:predicted  nucleic acid-binding Zn-ribbon protein
MNGDLDLLLQLQSIDYDLGELERSKEYIPDMMDNLRKEIADAEQKLDKTKSELLTARREQKEVELDIQTRQTKLKALQERMLAIKTNKEYDALIHEIDQVKEHISLLEDREMALMETIEALEKELDGMDDKVAVVRKVNSEQLNSLQHQIDTVGSKVQTKEAERQHVVGKVDKRIISTYERIRKGKGGAAVVMVKKRACGACYKALPPQKIQEIKLGERIITCDSCGRMLVWTADSDI